MLPDPTAVGRLPRRDEHRVVGDAHGEVLHDAPPAAELPVRLEAMCNFANGKMPGFFIHPVVRAIILHFWLAYDHPFVDGNGGRPGRCSTGRSCITDAGCLNSFRSQHPPQSAGPGRPIIFAYRIGCQRSDLLHRGPDQGHPESHRRTARLHQQQDWGGQGTGDAGARLESVQPSPRGANRPHALKHRFRTILSAVTNRATTWFARSPGPT